ncbi:MAG: NAD-dependent epimerase/dehydratase family protein, partial [Proteobacteria bacterium]|nr:NAD-dependent epimerase/dehydratase family protein [Pseudomonadota bacterium]
LKDYLKGYGISDNEVVLWGSGEPYREFLYVEDLADAVLYLTERLEAEDIKKISPDYFVNVGSGKDIKIKDLAGLIKDIVGYGGNIIYDKMKPDGTPRKLLDVSKVNSLGWHAKTALEEGVKKTYEWYLERLKN